jgi:hypothetical protein
MPRKPFIPRNNLNLAKSRQLFLHLGRLDGVVAQLVEHHNGIVGVIGSNPFGSTILNTAQNHYSPSHGAIQNENMRRT